jgi:hypothetical protein
MFMFDQFSDCTAVIISFSSSFCISAAQISAAKDKEFGQDGQGQGGYCVNNSDGEEELTFFSKNSTKEQSRSREWNERSRTDSCRSGSSKPKKASQRNLIMTQTLPSQVFSRKKPPNTARIAVFQLLKTKWSVHARNPMPIGRPKRRSGSSKPSLRRWRSKIKWRGRKIWTSSAKSIPTREPQKGPTSIYVAKIPVSKDLEARIPEVAGPKGPNLWRTTKFLNGEEDLIKVTAQVMGDIPDCKKYLEEPDVNLKAENILAFKETYGQLICKAINDRQNNTQSGLKTAYIERYDDKLPMPNPIQIVSVILREDLELPKKPKEPNAVDYVDISLFEANRTKYETRLAKYEERYA